MHLPGVCPFLWFWFQRNPTLSALQKREAFSGSLIPLRETLILNGLWEPQIPVTNFGEAFCSIACFFGLLPIFPTPFVFGLCPFLRLVRVFPVFTLWQRSINCVNLTLTSAQRLDMSTRRTTVSVFSNFEGPRQEPGGTPKWGHSDPSWETSILRFFEHVTPHVSRALLVRKHSKIHFFSVFSFFSFFSKLQKSIPKLLARGTPLPEKFPK